MTDAEVYPLPAKLDLPAASGLARDLSSRRGRPLTLDAAGVTHLGTPGLQVLLSARKTWLEDGHALALTNFGESLKDQLSPLGLRPADLACGDGPAAEPETEAAETGSEP